MYGDGNRLGDGREKKAVLGWKLQALSRWARGPPGRQQAGPPPLTLGGMGSLQLAAHAAGAPSIEFICALNRVHSLQTTYRPGNGFNCLPGHTTVRWVGGCSVPRPASRRLNIALAACPRSVCGQHRESDPSAGATKTGASDRHTGCNQLQAPASILLFRVGERELAKVEETGGGL